MTNTYHTLLAELNQTVHGLSAGEKGHVVTTRRLETDPERQYLIQFESLPKKQLVSVSESQLNFLGRTRGVK